MKTYNSKQAKLNFNYPDNWSIKEEGNLISLYNAIHGVGVLQFSFFKVPNPDSILIKEELQDYVAERHKDSRVTLSPNYAQTDFLKDNEGRIWKYWIFLKAQILTFASYNCEENDLGKEDMIIERVIQEASLPYAQI